jgi:hypothetical protein
MIEKNYNELLVKKEPAARALILSLFNIDKRLNFNQAAVYHQFPIYPSSEEDQTISANVIFITKEFGAVIFQCIEYSEREPIVLQGAVSKLSEIDRLIFAKILKDAPTLQINRRSLKITIIPVIYINNYTGKNIDDVDIQIITSELQLEES